MRPFEEVAVSFASALVAGEFERARSLLTPELRAEISEVELRNLLLGMFEQYADGHPTGIHFDDEFSLLEWASKQSGDVGWAYVGITGEDFVEAVSVTISEVGGSKLIRNIEWGRP